MKRCALVVGHKPDKPGACNETYNVCEFNFNDNLIDSIMESLVDPIDPHGGIDLVKVLRKTYSNLPNEINELNPDFVVSFHCNAFNKKASGTETLYYHTSERGKKIAQKFQDNMVTVLHLPDRGIKGKRVEDRGGHLLRYVKAPCILIEPFFIDNDSDFERITNVRQSFVTAIQKSLFEAADLV
jgi:N-acetylmuramoyl-L-alanine amidase